MFARRVAPAFISVCTFAACVAEKKVASVTNVTDTATKTVSGAAQVPADQGLRLRLVDTTETEEYPAYKVEVMLAGKVDTIPGVLTFDIPVVTADGLLHGPIYAMNGQYDGIYTYNPRTRALSRTPLPVDAAGWASEVHLSPDAAHIAYIGGDSTGSQGIVRSWPATVVVLRTMNALQAPSDFSFNQVWWVNPDSVEFSWHTDVGRETKPPSPRFPFIEIYASLSASRFTVDTLNEQPIFRTVGKH